jgi:hypothetical protein
MKFKVGDYIRYTTSRQISIVIAADEETGMYQTDIIRGSRGESFHDTNTKQWCELESFEYVIKMTELEKALL